MFTTFRKRYLSKIISGTLLFYAFSGISSLLNYAFYPIIGRVVSVGEYGEIQFLISMFTQLAVGFVVLNIIAIIISVRSKTATEQSESVQTLNRVALYIMTPVVVISTIILFFMHSALDLREPVAVIGLGLAVLVSVPYTTSVGKLQGNGQFFESGIVGVVGALGKLLCSLGLVLLGLGVTGAILGVGVGTFIAYLLSLLLDNNKSRLSLIPNLFIKKHRLQQIAHVRSQSVVAIFVMASLTILSVFDTVISRITLTHTDAGQYAAVATASKIILAATMPLMWLALPHATRGQSKDTRKYLMLTSLLTIVFCASMLIFSGPVVRLLTGIDASSYLRFSFAASIAMSLCAIAFLLGAIMISRGYLKIVTISTLIGLLAGAVSFFVAISLSPVGAAILAQAVCSLFIITGGIISIKRDLR